MKKRFFKGNVESDIGNGILYVVHSPSNVVKTGCHGYWGTWKYSLIGARGMAIDIPSLEGLFVSKRSSMQKIKKN